MLTCRNFSRIFSICMGEDVDALEDDHIVAAALQTGDAAMGAATRTGAGQALQLQCLECRAWHGLQFGMIVLFWVMHI